MHTLLPFPALVGLEAAQQALLLLAVEPRLRGVVISAPAGTGKSSLVRGIRDLLGSEAVPFVEAPLSADVENLLGGLDLEATLRTGRSVVQPGLLARAHDGIVYVDGINLLTDASANLLLGVLDDGEIRVERESLSLRAPARFSLCGSYDPAEGEPRQHLLDRVGLLVTLHGQKNAEQRSRVIQHNLLRDAATWVEDVDFLRGLVLAAREQLLTVTIESTQIAWLSQTALLYGVQGHRVDLFAVYAARAAAALAMRDAVDDEDLELAARLVILPRATQVPTAPPEMPEEEAPAQEQPAPPPEHAPPDPAAPEPSSAEDNLPEPSPPEQDQADEELPEEAPPENGLALPDEQVFAALTSELPENLDELPFRTVRRGRSGSRGATEGSRGRHVRSLPGDPRRARIDVSATLRAAAPWQPIRRATTGKSAERHSQFGERHLIFQGGDVRVKQFRSKAGALFCFGVDASGSMALHRMRQAKGAVHALLEKAYVKRDRVALMAFRGQEAELLMPPTQSVELAKRALDTLPTGGGTPLASALLLGCDVAQQAQMRGIFQTVLVLLTDGRANVALHEGGDIKAELQQIGRFVADARLHVIVVDTQRSYLSRGEAKQLADWVGGDYAYLPNASGEQIAELAVGKAEQ